MRTSFAVGLAMWGCLALGCKDKDTKPTREECTQVAEHIADLIIAHYASNADQWYDAVTAEAGDTGIPPTVTRDSFKGWLDSPEGKTWKLQRRGNTLTGVQQGIEPCVQKATKAQVRCLLAAKSRDDVLACDKKHGTNPGPAGSATAGSGSAAAAPAATGSGSAESK
jgi:hypothetical protein